MWRINAFWLRGGFSGFCMNFVHSRRRRILSSPNLPRRCNCCFPLSGNWSRPDMSLDMYQPRARWPGWLFVRTALNFLTRHVGRHAPVCASLGCLCRWCFADYVAVSLTHAFKHCDTGVCKVLRPGYFATRPELLFSVRVR